MLGKLSGPDPSNIPTFEAVQEVALRQTSLIDNPPAPVTVISFWSCHSGILCEKGSTDIFISSYLLHVLPCPLHFP